MRCYVWLESLPPLKYESVQTAFVPKAHADAGLFLLLQAAELSREFDHVDHRAALWKEPCVDGDGCLGDQCASGMTGTDAGDAWLTERRIVRESFGEHLLPLSLYQANCDIALMLSWFNAGYGWSGSYGS